MNLNIFKTFIEDVKKTLTNNKHGYSLVKKVI